MKPDALLANRPDRIVLLRHGESAGNADDRIYETVPDHALDLTASGRDQARVAGARLTELFGADPVQVWASPYRRTRQTFELLGLDVDPDDVRYEPRLREQDWANFQDPESVAAERKLRDRYGHFYYRFAEGESGSDVYDRVSSFLESLHRNFVDPDCERNVLIITHGLTMRLFCMRWFRWSVEYFESLSNPGNGEVVVLHKQPDHHYKLAAPFAQWDTTVTPNGRERSSWL